MARNLPDKYQKVRVGADTIEGLTDELIELQLLSIRSKYGHGGDLNQLRNSFIAMRENLANRIRVLLLFVKERPLGLYYFSNMITYCILM